MNDGTSSHVPKLVAHVLLADLELGLEERIRISLVGK